MIVRYALAVTGIISSVLIAAATPAQAANDWTTVSAGGSHTCGIRAQALYCWGNDTNEQLGTPDNNSRITPAQITSATDWTSVSAGFQHTCAIRSTGKLYCWGYNGFGQIGIGSAGGNVATPKLVTAATDWKAVSAGYYFTCAIRSVGKLYCWGSDATGQIGDGTSNSPVYSPKKITEANDWKAVSAGSFHTCAIRSAGKLYCWGSNTDGRLGIGTLFGVSESPSQVTPAATDWNVVAAGGRHTCAIRSVGKLYCWGDNQYAQVGNGNTSGTDVAAPKQITAATDWKTLQARNSLHTCAIRSVGKLYCWGNTGSGQINSSGPLIPDPVQVTSATDWTVPAAGIEHSCAIRAGGKLYCWGFNGGGRLGAGYNSSTPNPRQVTATDGQLAP